MANINYVIGVTPTGKLCPRCGQQHGELVCIPFGHPIVIDLPGMAAPLVLNYYAKCPVTREPILIKIEEVTDSTKSVYKAKVGAS